MSNSFDNKIKESLENFEMPYDAGAWAELEKQLPSNSAPAAKSSSGKTGKIAAVISVLALAGGAIWFSQSDEKSTEKEPIVIEQSVIEEKAETVSPAEEIPSIQSEQQPTVETTQVAEEKLVKPTVTSDKNKNEEEFIEPSELVRLEDEVAVKRTEAKPSKLIEVATATETEQPLILDFSVKTLKVCVGEDVEFTNQSTDKKAAMNWDFGDGFSSSEINPTHQYLVPGVYEVTLNSDRAIAPKSVIVKVNATPTPMMSIDRKVDGYAIPLYTLSTVTQPNESAVWSFSDGTTFSGNNATHLFRKRGQQIAKLTVSNNAGCSFSVERKIDCEDFNLLAPAAFTPNGDGVNETFIPEALPEMAVDFEMTIQNPRTGQVVYRTENPLSPWNGKLNNNGQKLETGVYIWTVVLKENIVGNKVFNGKINLQP